MYIAVFSYRIDIHRFFDSVETVTATKRATVPEEKAED